MPGFNQLFEAALNKECEGLELGLEDPKTRTGIKKQKEKEMVNPTLDSVLDDLLHSFGSGESFVLTTLKHELKSIIDDAIGASKKWTWGVELSLEDLKGMVRGIDRESGESHSGDRKSTRLNSSHVD